MLCADDYGMNEGVDEAVLTLAAAGRLSATSCLVTPPRWRKAATRLPTTTDRFASGLHINLTWGAPLGPMPGLAPQGALPPLGRLLWSALLRRLPAREIAGEISRQADAFCDATGRAPDFIDGHQHVHILPVIREALIAEAARRGWNTKLWLRDPADRLATIVGRPAAAKAALVAWLSRRFNTIATRKGFRLNRGFSGFSDFAPTGDVAAAMPRYLDGLGTAPLVMCHPGIDVLDPTDDIAAARTAEYLYLSSGTFDELLSARSIRLTGRPAGWDMA